MITVTKRFTSSLIVFTAFAVAVPTAHGDLPTSPLVVVAGEVTAVAYVKGDGYRATIKVLRVCAGPESLKGTEIVDHTGNAGSAGNLAIPLLKVGEQGLWLMATDANTGKLFVLHRYRKDSTPNYDRRVEWADTVGRLSKLDAPKRLAAARELCSHKTPEVAQLGVDVLFGAPSADAAKAGLPAFLDELLKNRDASPSALVRADQLFERRDGKKWVGSSRQRELFARFEGVMTEADATEVVMHVISTRYRESPDGTALTAAQAADLLTKIVTDPEQPKAVRLVAVERVAAVGRNAGTRAGLTFDVLAAAVRKGDAAVRLEAAKGLASLRWPAPFHQAELSALLKDEKDAEVAKLLTAARDKVK